MFAIFLCTDMMVLQRIEENPSNEVFYGAIVVISNYGNIKINLFLYFNLLV